MKKKVIKKRNLKQLETDVAFWLSKTPRERIEAVEFLRKQFNGSSERFQTSIRIIQQP
jgi:hypothetical protein